VILYDDASAGHRAMHTATTLSNGRRGTWLEIKTQPWRFDLLDDPEWFALALADAINADMLILSVSRENSLPAMVEDWLKLCLMRKRGTDAAVVALLGPDDHLDEPVCPRFRFVQRVAEAAGLDFFAPGWLAQDLSHSGRFHHGLFPVLAEAFHRIEPTPRWGINE
jgi:hypothetical protein